ncbi:uncharacterized protein DUF937 [Luteimonas cucumeris]|uniref:Uncharacterized protein DUF937 n=1 Tax=Luteimonas cucumeris TaxID=985012 RepID=A0A562LB38_9GAMM|nr:DUF937 domain-containing protein [Luteimonas cucumeris]TWI04776.1 uncharacterized protein DUF937 [Luteimonas cucumeris]
MNASSSLTDDLASQLQGAPLQQIAQQLGVDPSQANAAVGAALPLLMGALGRNASQPQGAQALFGALQKDHAGLDLGSVLGSVLGGGGQGERILGHVLGDREPRAEQALGQATGLGGDKANMLLRWLAPIVMAYLAKRMFDQRQGTTEVAGNDAASSPQALGDILGQERQRIGEQGGLGGGMMSAVLDQDADGDVDLSDLMRVGQSLLGNLPRA